MFSMGRFALAFYIYSGESELFKLAMPRIGCGLDGLQWTAVSQLLKESMIKYLVFLILIFFILFSFFI